MSAAPRLRWAVQERTLGAVEDLDWAMDELAVFRAAAAEGRALDGLIRVYVPEPTVAFGQRDARLPGFAAAAVAGHSGQMRSVDIAGSGRRALVFGTRTHYYEGKGVDAVVHGVRTVSELAYHDFISQDLPDHELLGELVRDRVRESSGHDLAWEVIRVGEP